MKASTRQRFCALGFGYSESEGEAAIVARESGLDLGEASAIVSFGLRTRRLQGFGLDEGRGRGCMVPAAMLVVQRLTIIAACRMSMVDVMTDDPAVNAAPQSALDAAI
ncbi:MAG: CbbQ/NirQ/NorQ C-terminal domain-containing protein [Burkholderiaceae bacterium]